MKGTISQWMSSHHCVGVYPYNKTCKIRNLYFNTINSKSVWTYLLSVPTNISSTSLHKRIENLLDEVTVDMSSRKKNVPLPLSVAVFTASRLSINDHALDTFHPIQYSNTTGDPLNSVFEYVDRHGCRHFRENHYACVVEGTSGIALRPFFVLERTMVRNVGHSMWDDCLLFPQVMEDLGLLDSLPEYDLLLFPHNEEWSPRFSTVFELFALTSPQMHPVQSSVISNVGPGTFFFPEIAVGLTGMSPHNLRPSMAVYGAERRAVWKFRSYIMKALGHPSADIFRPAASLQNHFLPKKYRFLYVRSKRPIVNEVELIASVSEQFPMLQVDVVRWEEVGGFGNEVKELIKTHIFMSGDGTVAISAFFLPEGAVHIQLGVSRPWGTQIQNDFIYPSFDHIRVLYYSGMSSDEHSGNPLSGFKVPPSKLNPLIVEAIHLLDKGYHIPVPSTVNMAPSARLLSFLMIKYKNFGDAIIEDGTWEDVKAFRYQDGLYSFCTKKLRKPCPESFQEDINTFCVSYGCDP